MANKGFAFILGGAICLIFFALIAMVAVLAGGHAHANPGGLLVLFLIGGVTGLIAATIYNKGRKDASKDSPNKKADPPTLITAPASSSTADFSDKTRSRLIVLFIFAFPFIVITGFLILEHFDPTPATPPPALIGTNFIQSPR